MMKRGSLLFAELKFVQAISEYLELALSENPGLIIKEAAARCLATHRSKVASDS